MNTTKETREVVQDSDEARQLEQEGWCYWRTYHDSDKRSANYGKRIDIYRPKTKSITAMSSASGMLQG